MIIKTYKHLFEKMLDEDTMLECIYKASLNKRNRDNVIKILEDPYPVIRKTKQELQDGTWEPHHHAKNAIREGAHKKERIIEKPIFNNEQIVHHMLINQLEPIFLDKFYELSCSCVVGRGSTTVLKVIRKWRDQYKGQIFYVAELDIRKFYQNIDTEILKGQLNRIIKDKKFMEVLNKIIDNSAPGLPLGYYTSPWLSNFYLTPLDMHILHKLHPDHYVRYADNLFLFHTDKDILHSIVKETMKYCQEELHVSIKDDWQVFQFEHNGKGRAINCLGFIIHEDRVTLRKTLLKRIRAKANRLHKKGHITLEDAQAMVSYSGWLKNTDTYGYYYQWVKPNVSFGYCKKLVSKCAKKRNEEEKKKKNRS